MNKLLHIWVQVCRLPHSLGFGIQSPTDFYFDRHVINEHLPYYAYETLGVNNSWLRRKLGLLYFRLVNWQQPKEILDGVGVAEFLQAGCKRALVVSDMNRAKVDLAIVSCPTDALVLLDRCDGNSLMVVEGIQSDKLNWRSIRQHPKVTISWDLYYCGILQFDPKRKKQHYRRNF